MTPLIVIRWVMGSTAHDILLTDALLSELTALALLRLLSLKTLLLFQGLSAFAAHDALGLDGHLLLALVLGVDAVLFLLLVLVRLGVAHEFIK